MLQQDVGVGYGTLPFVPPGGYVRRSSFLQLRIPVSLGICLIERGHTRPRQLDAVRVVGA